MGEPGIDSLVDLCANPIDQALCDRDVIVSAEFAVRCRRGSDVIMRSLLHGDTIHRKCQRVYYPERCRVLRGHLAAAWLSRLYQRVSGERPGVRPGGPPKAEPGALTPGQRRRLRRRLDKMSAWPYAVRSIGAEGLHFHDLRHTGNTFAASSGAGLRDLMARMGHDSERAAMIYQHEARGADRAITDAIDSHVQAERPDDDDDDGQAGALAPVV
jgi:Phage integrase family